MQSRAVVLGAGLTGLRAAWELAKNDFEVHIIDRAPEVGGMAKSHFHKGYTFDHGPHGFYSREAWILEEFKELVGGEANYRYLEKWSQIYYKNQYFNHPLRVSDIAAKMSPVRVLLALGSFLYARLRVRWTEAKEVNTEQFLINQFGRVLYEEFFGPYTQKVWNIHPCALDADFARDRVPQINLWEVMKKMVFKGDRVKLTPSGRIATHDLHRFYYPRKGAYVLSQSLAERLRQWQGHFYLSSTITKINTDTRRLFFRHAGEERALDFDYLISTIPLNTFIELLRPVPPAEVLAAAKSLTYRAILLVCLCIKKDSVLGPFWIYFTDRIFTRISEYKRFSPDLVPAGKSGICLEVTCDPGDALYTAADEEIFRRVLPDLEDLGLVKKEEIEDYIILREPHAYPIYQVGYKKMLQSLIGYIEGIEGFYTAGRQGAFLYCNQDAALKSGYEAAVHLKATRLRTSKEKEDAPTP